MIFTDVVLKNTLIIQVIFFSVFLMMTGLMFGKNKAGKSL